MLDGSASSLRDGVRVRRATPNFRWPGGVRTAVAFNVVHQGWADSSVLSRGNYGATRGIQRLMRIADANRIKVSAVVNGIVADQFPATVAALAQGGHDIVAHSYAMDVEALDEAGIRTDIARTTTALEARANVRVSGWISPRDAQSAGSPRLLAEAGYVWHGDCFDDDLPALVDIDGRAEPIVAIPQAMDFDDMRQCVALGKAPAALIDPFRGLLERASLADAQPFLIDVTAHADVLGRPTGAWVFDTMMKLALAQRNIWIATQAEVARYALANAMHFE